MSVVWRMLAGLGAITLLSSCAESTGILPMGTDTYTVSENYAPIRGGATTAEKVALTEANQYCEKQGMVFEPTNTQESVAPFQSAYGPTKYSLTFRCFPPNSANVQPPNLEPAPNIVIEQRTQ